MNVDLELYRIFCVLAKYENISKATQELYISQPAITQRINNLEKILNIKLFHRNPGGMKLTNEGKQLYYYVKDSIEVMSNVEKNFDRYLQKNKKNNINIKSTDFMDNIFLSNSIVEFSEKCPEIGINLDIVSEEEAINALKNGDADIITIKEVSKIKNGPFKIIASKNLNPCLYTSQKYLEKCGRVDIYKQAENYNFILPKKSSLESIGFNKFCEKYHLNIQSKYETESIDIRNYLVANGLGIAVGCREYIEENLKNNEFIEIVLKEKLPSYNVNWVICKEKEEIKKFLEVI